jgi:hypothetical protein
MMSHDDNGACPGCAHPRPREMSEDEQRSIPPRTLEVIDSTPGRPMICGYCGCVYKINTPPIPFGYLNNPLKGKGWVSLPPA